MTLDPDLAAEAKALVALASRNGSKEALHAGNPCPMCSGKTDVSHVSDNEMKAVTQSAVDTPYRLLWQRDYDSAAYKDALAFGRRNTLQWNDPDLQKPSKGGSRTT